MMRQRSTLHVNVVFAAMLCLLMSASVILTPDAPVNQHQASGPYDHMLLDGIDAGLNAMLPEPVYKVVAQIMQVLASPATVIDNARQHTGLDQSQNALAQKANSVLDGIIWVAVVGGSVLGVIIRVLVKMVRDR